MDEYRTFVATNKIWRSFGLDSQLMELAVRTAAIDKYKSIRRSDGKYESEQKELTDKAWDPVIDIYRDKILSSYKIGAAATPTDLDSDE